MTLPTFNLTVPEIYAIEVTNNCNFDCNFCIRKKFDRPLGFLDPDLARLISERDLEGSYFVEFQQAGEPLLHPGLLNIINYFKGKVLTGLSTNGFLIHEQIPALLQLDYLTISIDSITDYESLRLGGKTDRLVKNIELLLTKRMGGGPIIDLQLIEFPGFEGELDKIYELSNKRGWTSEVNIRTVDDSFKGFLDPKFPVTSKDMCLNPWLSVNVQWDGMVVACCMDFKGFLAFGNLYQQSLAQIWRSKRLKDLRRSHQSGKLGYPCNRCYMRSPALLHHRILKESILNKIVKGEK
jgi:radical SAM protein with 4Fe4S-binding SPASM domain